MPRQPINNLVKNGDFEYAPAFTAAMTGNVSKWIDGTAAGSSTNDLYRWACSSGLGTHTEQYDSSVKYSGSYSMKLALTATGSSAVVRIVPSVTTANLTRYGIPVLPSTSYTATFKMKTNITSGSATTGACMKFHETDAVAGNNVDNATTSILDTTDWTTYTKTFTTASTTRFLTPACYLWGGDGAATLIGEAWFDDIRLDLTSNTTRSTASNRLALQDMKSSLMLTRTSSQAVRFSSSVGASMTTPFSVSFWFKNKIYPADFETMYSAGNSGGSQYFRIFWELSSGKIRVQYQNDAAGAVSNVAANRTNLIDNRWHHIVYSCNAGVAALYIDGVADTSNFNYTPSGVLTIDQYSFGSLYRSASGNYFDGYLSNGKVFAVALTATQALNEYIAGTSGITPVTNVKFDEGAGSTAYDSSGNGNNGTITSGTYVLDTPTKIRKQVNGNLVYNGDFEYLPPVLTAATNTAVRWIDGTAGGSTTNNLFGWAIESITGTGSVGFDTTTSYSGVGSLKVSTLATGSKVVGALHTIGSGLSQLNRLIPALPSTSYTLSYRMKTSYVSGDSLTGAMVYLIQRNGAGTYISLTNPTSIKTTTDWTYYSVSLTTNSATRFLNVAPVVEGNQGTATLIMDAWFDNIELRPTTPTTRTAVT